MYSFKKGDPIIWNSGFGYDIGLFVSEDSGQYNNYKVDLVSGIVTGEISLPQSEIEPYTEDRVKVLMNEYGYVIKF